MTTREHHSAFHRPGRLDRAVASFGPDAADEVRRKHFSALRQAIADLGGTEVKNLGDGLMVVFPVASAALNCGVAMQQAVHRDNQGSERPLGLRVGLSAGEATREDDDYFGDPVIEAARLCAKAEAGQILVTDVVRANAGRRSTHAFTSLGELELKGLPDPIETFAVSWEPLPDDATIAEGVPLPSRLGHRPDVGVIGREAELIALGDRARKRWRQARAARCILIAGEPGQGKTTLVVRTRSPHPRNGHDRAPRSLRRGDGGALPTLRRGALPLRGLCRRRHCFALMCRDHGGELSRMVPALQKRLGDLPVAPEHRSRHRALPPLRGRGGTAASRQSRDARCSSCSTTCTGRTSRASSCCATWWPTPRRARLLVIGTYRDAELSASHPLTEALAALLREPAGGVVHRLEGS